jgi:hypothetical protein
MPEKWQRITNFTMLLLYNYNSNPYSKDYKGK